MANATVPRASEEKTVRSPFAAPSQMERTEYRGKETSPANAKKDGKASTATSAKQTTPAML